MRTAISAIALTILLSANPAKAEDWHGYKSPGDGFQTSAPSFPVYNTQKSLITVLGSAEYHEFYSESGDGSAAYEVAVLKYTNPFDAQYCLNQIKQAQMATMGAYISNERSVSLNGLPGTDFDWVNGRYFGHNRIFCASRTVYEISVLWDRGSTWADYIRFDNSFQFIGIMMR